MVTRSTRRVDALPLESEDRLVQQASEDERVEPLTRHESRIIYGPGEPLRVEGQHVDGQGRPCSLWTAIVCWQDQDGESFDRMLRDIFGLRPGKDSLMLESLLYCAQETNKVTVTRRARSIVKWAVWIDRKGRFKLEVRPRRRTTGGVRNQGSS